MKSRSDAEIGSGEEPSYWDAANVGMDSVRVRFMEDAADATMPTSREGPVGHRPLVSSDKLIASDKLEVFPMFGTTYFFFPLRAGPVERLAGAPRPGAPGTWDQYAPATRSSSLRPAGPSIPGYPTVTGIASQNVEEGKKLLADAGFPRAAGFHR